MKTAINAEANTQTILLNPYSVRLKKEPFMKMESKPFYVSGDFRIYKYSTDWYVHTFKNIVVSERVKPNKEILTNLIGTTQPTGEVAVYHELERPRAAMMEGIKEAKKRNFKIV